MGMRLTEVSPVAAMITLEVLLVGFITLNKEAMLKGMSPFHLVFYSTCFATLLLAPLAFFFERTQRTPLNLSLVCKFFFISILGTTIPQNAIAVAVNYTSPTLSSATKNLLPAFTFILALLFRMEKLKWRSLTAQMKIIGTVLSISGGMIVVLYKGPSIISSSGNDLIPMASSLLESPKYVSDYLTKKETDWAIGGLLFTAAWISVALWTTLQGKISREYPSHLSLVSFYMFFASIQCGAVSLVLERNHPNAWKLMPDIKMKLVAIIYAGVFGYVGLFCVQVWCIHKKGPVFTSMFKPLGVVVAALMSFVFFGENLHLGTVIGTAITVTGFYGVLWAKSKENEQQEEGSVTGFFSNRLPLLQNENLQQGIKKELL